MLETENNEREGRFFFKKKMAEIDETTWRLSGIKKIYVENKIKIALFENSFFLPFVFLAFILKRNSIVFWPFDLFSVYLFLFV